MNSSSSNALMMHSHYGNDNEQEDSGMVVATMAMDDDNDNGSNDTYNKEALKTKRLTIMKKDDRSGKKGSNRSQSEAATTATNIGNQWSDVDGSKLFKLIEKQLVVIDAKVDKDTTTPVDHVNNDDDNDGDNSSKVVQGRKVKHRDPKWRNIRLVDWDIIATKLSRYQIQSIGHPFRFVDNLLILRFHHSTSQSCRSYFNERTSPNFVVRARADSLKSGTNYRLLWYQICAFIFKIFIDSVSHCCCNSQQALIHLPDMTGTYKQVWTRNIITHYKRYDEIMRWIDDSDM
jgi:hypothetical protein